MNAPPGAEKAPGFRLLWVGKRPDSGAAGDEIFDRKTVAACRARGHTVDLWHPERVGRLAEVANLLSGVPHYRARFASAANRAALRAREAEYDAVICSWEPFDALVDQLIRPSVLIAHNVTSLALPALFPGSRVAAVAGWRARLWERSWYRSSRFAAIAALSRHDLAFLHGLPDPPALLLLPPGMPPCSDLAADAGLQPELVISGTYDWVPKRRDILRFAREYAALDQRLPCRAEALPAEATALLRPGGMPTEAETGAALRFGVITDRFEAGHKLKTLAYIAANQIVLSFSDVAFDVADIADHAFFLRRIQSVSDIAGHVREVAALPPPVLRERFVAFQRACAAAFTWDAVAGTLLEAVRHAATPASARTAAMSLT